MRGDGGGHVCMAGACVTGGMCGRGTCMAGGMHGGGHAWWGVVCMAGRGCAWQAGGMHGGGHAWQGGMHGRGVCMAGGHAWQGGMHGGGVYGRYYEIRILLECILICEVKFKIFQPIT